MTEHPKIFVSYSHDSQDHKDWVVKLSTDLRQHMGVDVVLDQWDLRIGSDLALYMEQGLGEAELVLCICSDTYVEKANSGVGGSGYEKMIMTQAMIEDTNIDYIIPIIRNNETKIRPKFLSTKLYIDFSEDGNYVEKLSELTSRIFDEDVAKKPSLGISPFSQERATKIDILNTIAICEYHNPDMKGATSFDYSNNSGCFQIGSGQYEFITKWSECGMNTIYAYKDDVELIGYLSGVGEIPELDFIEQFDFTSRSRKVCIGEVIIWKNRQGHFAATKIIDIKTKSRGADKDQLSFKYKIYS